MDNDNQELREQVEYGRKAKIASEVVADFIMNSKALVLYSLENNSDFDEQGVFYKVMYLRLLRQFETSIQTFIDTGEIAKKELNKDGD